MKKLAPILIAFILLLSFSACTPAGGTENPGEEQPPIENTDTSAVDKLPEDCIAFAATFHDSSVEIEADTATEPVWADDGELQKYKDLISALKLREIKKFAAISLPNDNEISIELSAEQVEEIVTAIKLNMPTTFSQPENPSTGGQLSLYLETEAQKMLIAFNGNWLTLRLDSEPALWIFNAADCEKAFNNIWGTVDSLLQSAEVSE